MNIYFNFEFRSCIDLFSSPMTLKIGSDKLYNNSVQFQLNGPTVTVKTLADRYYILDFS